VFAHLMANIKSVQYRDVRLQVPEAGILQEVGTLQGDQPRTFVIETTEPTFTVALTGSDGTIASVTVDAATVPAASPDAAVTQIRLALVEAMCLALERAESKDIGSAQAAIHSWYTATRVSPAAADPRVVAMLADVVHRDQYKGQIAKAVESAASFERWGRHFLPAMIGQFENQWATNFKDESSKLMGGRTVKALVLRGEEIYNSLPPPTPSCTHAYRGSATALAAASQSLSSTNTSAGPCFLPGSRVTLANGDLKRCDQMQPGDFILPGVRVRCVIKTLVQFADVARFSSLPESGITLWHPVFVDGDWQFPADIAATTRVQTDAIYNFVLEYDGELLAGSPMDADDRPGTIIIDGVTTCTMGHTMTGYCIGHSYFGKREPGKRNVIDDLSAQPGWTTGYITWSNLTIQTDETGLICGMAP